MVSVAGKMYRPTDVAVDVGNNSVFVVEQFNHRISKWDYLDSSYTFTLDDTWGTNVDGTTGEGAPIGDGGPTDHALYRPTGIAFENNRLTVTDTFHNRIRTLNASTGDFIDSVGQGGSGDEDFYRPAGIAVNTANTILVIADEFNHRAVKYTVGDTPTFAQILDDPSTGDDRAFNRPHGVIFDVTNSFFNVTDSYRSLLNKYDSTAENYLFQFGVPGIVGKDVFFPGSGQGLLTGTTTTAFADTRNNNIKTVDDDTINFTNTTAGTGNGQLYYPESVESFVDDFTNYVLVANTRNHRVETYSNTGSVLASQSPFNFGSPKN